MEEWDRQKNQTTVKPKDKILIFFFGTFFVLILGKHYFANLGGSPGEKSQLLKWYYFGLVFWFLILGVLIWHTPFVNGS